MELLPLTPSRSTSPQPRRLKRNDVPRRTPPRQQLLRKLMEKLREPLTKLNYGDKFGRRWRPRKLREAANSTRGRLPSPPGLC